MNIGILGPNGRLGRALVGIGCSPIVVNIDNPTQLRAANLNQYDTVINCAAITAVDRCQDPSQAREILFYDRAIRINSMALENIRGIFKGRFIHISTDYVFPGTNGPYKETDKRRPVNDYGITKLGGETLLETHASKGKTFIVRTTGLYGSGEDFSTYVLDKLKENKSVQASSNLQGNMTYVPHLCEALLKIAEINMQDQVGFIHVASSDVCTRYEFGRRLAKAFGFSEEKIIPMLSEHIHGWKAPRPTLGGLNVNKAIKIGLPIYTIEQGLKAYKESFK